MTDFRWGLLLWAAAFLARVVSGLGSSIFGTDGCHYLLMADWMAAGRWHDALSIAYHPLYPLLIAAAGMGVGTEAAGEWVSIVLGSAATVPLFLTVKSLLGRPTAVFASLLYAFYPRLVEVQADVMTEGTFMFFFFASMWLTLRMMEEPSLDRGVVLGAAAAGAFLTRPEGLLSIALALAWPVVQMIRRRDRLGIRAGGVLLMVGVVVLAVSPYLLWVKAERGRWALSARPSVAISVEKAVGVAEHRPDDENPENKGSLYRVFLISILRLSMYGLLVPFYVAGAAALRGVGIGKTLFFLSFPLGYLAGLLFALRTHVFMAERYVMVPMVLLGALAAHGMVAGIGAAARKWRDRSWVPVVCGTAALLLVVAPVFRCFKIHRAELLSFPGAARWILAKHGSPISISGLEQVSYYCGSRSHYLPMDLPLLKQLVDEQSLDYIAYSEREVRRSAAFVAMLRSWDRLDPPLEYEGPPGTWKVYFQKVK